MSLEEELFQLIRNRDYKSALHFINNNPKLDINAVEPKGNTFLALAAKCGSKCAEFYQFIDGLLENSGFRHANTTNPITKKMPFSDAIYLSDSEFVKIIIKHRYEKNINVITDGDQLWYEKIVISIKRIELELKAKPNDLSNLRDLLKKETIVLAVMRDVTIRHALLTDDVLMLEKLASLGANLHLPLEDGTLPIQLIEELPNLKVFTWLKAHVSKLSKPSPFALFKDVEQDSSNATSSYEQSVAQVLQQQREAQTKLIQQFFGVPTGNVDPTVGKSSNSAEFK